MKTSKKWGKTGVLRESVRLRDCERPGKVCKCRRGHLSSRDVTAACGHATLSSYLHNMTETNKMLVGGRRSLSRIFTLAHLVKCYCLVEASIHFTGQGPRTLLVWAASAGMGDLTLAVLKQQLLFISSPLLSALLCSYFQLSSFICSSLINS